MFVEAETTRAVNYYCKCQQRYQAKGNDQQQNLGHDKDFCMFQQLNRKCAHILLYILLKCTNTIAHSLAYYRYIPYFVIFGDFFYRSTVSIKIFIFMRGVCSLSFHRNKGILK